MGKTKITREAILRAAAETVRRAGAERVSARAVAEELGCSTQPIYSQFHGMRELLSALREEAKARYGAFIEEGAKGAKNGYEAFGMGFVRFAGAERGLFRYLFLTPCGGMEDPFLEEIVGEMGRIYGMPEEKARAFHADMTVYSCGLATRVYAGDELTEEEIAAALRREFYALYALYFPERAGDLRRDASAFKGKRRDS